MENETNNNLPAESQHSLSGIVGTLIIVAVLIAGGWYFIGNRVDKIQEQKNQQNDAKEIGNIITGSSTEISDIQADLDNLNLDALDSKL
jgi:preprotein translocase subunit YajC